MADGTDRVQTELKLLDSGFRFQQDRDTIANGINALALIALEAVFPSRHQRLAADRACNHFEQFRANHDNQF